MEAIKLIDVDLPDFGMPETIPAFDPRIYRERIRRFEERVRDCGLKAVVLYADREHFANLAYLTGFEPRFEEALAVLIPGRNLIVITGPENQGSARSCPLDLHVELYQPFGLLGQQRQGTRPLADLLRSCGLKSAMQIGVIGWKYFSSAETATPAEWIEAPAFIVDVLRAIAGDHGRVVNATRILMEPVRGLRAINEIEQLAQFEFSACHTSEAIKRVIFGVRPGMREFDAVKLMSLNGVPLSCHTMLSTGPRAYCGLGSPTDKVIQLADPFTTALGIWGALNCRAGWLVHDSGELPDQVRDYLEKLAIPYFGCVVEWYETLAIGVEGGTLSALVQRHLGDPFFGVFLNPGHLIHLDEWMNTPIYQNSKDQLQSGQALQVDIIPATNSPYFTINIEDGIALVDERGRREFSERYVEAWSRINARREFMADILGIRLKSEVLPFSNIPAYLPPFILSPTKVLARR